MQSKSGAAPGARPLFRVGEKAGTNAFATVSLCDGKGLDIDKIGGARILRSSMIFAMTLPENMRGAGEAEPAPQQPPVV